MKIWATINLLNRIHTERHDPGSGFSFFGVGESSAPNKPLCILFEASLAFDMAYAWKLATPKLMTMRPNGRKKTAAKRACCDCGDKSPNPTVVRVHARKYLIGWLKLENSHHSWRIPLTPTPKNRHGEHKICFQMLALKKVWLTYGISIPRRPSWYIPHDARAK